MTFFDYDLVMRQQPKHAKISFGDDKHPKGPIDPPPVVRLQIVYSAAASSSSSAQSPSLDIPPGSGAEVDPEHPPKSANTNTHTEPAATYVSSSLIQSPYLFCFAVLCKADDEAELNMIEDGKTRYMTGNAVSSLYHLRDPGNGNAEGFFVFPDIGVRVEGSFRLKFTLFEMQDATVHHCKTLFTDPFTVYSQKQFPGLDDSTELSRSFAMQGLKMRIKGGLAPQGKAQADILGSVPPRSSNLAVSHVKRPRSREEEEQEHRLSYPVKRPPVDYDPRFDPRSHPAYSAYPDHPPPHLHHHAPQPYPHPLRPTEHLAYLPQRSLYARNHAEGSVTIHRPTTAPAATAPGQPHDPYHHPRHYASQREGPSRLAYQYGPGPEPPYHLPVPVHHRPRDRYESGMRHSYLPDNNSLTEDERLAHDSRMITGEARPTSAHRRSHTSTSPTRSTFPTAGYSMSRSYRPVSRSKPRLPSLAEVIPHEESMYALSPPLSPRSHAAHSLTLYRSGRLSEGEDETLRAASEEKLAHSTGSLHSLLNPADEMPGRADEPFAPELSSHQDIKPDFEHTQCDMAGLEAG